MAVTNLVKEQEDHVMLISKFAKDAIKAASSTLIDLDEPELGSVNIRVGLHSGPVVSNVVGSRNPKFTIIGDTVNCAARMESNSLPLKIQCSQETANVLAKRHPQIPCTYRGRIPIKGKGEMPTYWVFNEDEGTSITNRRSTDLLLKAISEEHLSVAGTVSSGPTHNVRFLSDNTIDTTKPSDNGSSTQERRNSSLSSKPATEEKKGLFSW